MKTKLSRSYKCSCPSKKSKKEKRLKFRWWSLTVLKTYVISFRPKTPQETGRYFLPDIALRVFPLVHQQANKLGTLLGIAQDCPKRLKKAFHKAQATSQWSRWWSIDSLFLLHIQHLSITMICRFLRLSIVRIFLRAVDQAEKAVLKGTFIFQILFQGKGVTSLPRRAL
jgi:hypothetical protein